jgi:hypothetical protein
VKIRPGVSSYVNGVFSVPVAVQNLIPQPIGTTDGVTTDPKGIRVFLESPPALTRGSGSISTNADGTGTFTASDQEFWQYNQRLQHGDISGNKVWAFTMPPTVEGFRFTVYVAAAVPYPQGWVDVTPSPLVIQPFSDFRLTATVVNALGLRVGGSPSISWSSPDTTVATVTSVGVLSPKRAGTIQITATGGGVSGTATLQVLGMTRVWEGTVSTDWSVGGNWAGGIVPVSADSVLIPNPAAGPHYPVLVDNRQVAGVTVGNGATISIGPFDLTATGNVFTGLSGGIDGSSGRVVLAGSARTVQGLLPRVRVPGTYTLTGNLTLRAPLQVDLGRITSSSFRIQATSF